MNGTVIALRMALENPAKWCFSRRCDYTNWGGTNRLHLRKSDCPTFNQQEIEEAYLAHAEAMAVDDAEPTPARKNPVGQNRVKKPKPTPGVLAPTALAPNVAIEILDVLREIRDIMQEEPAVEAPEPKGFLTKTLDITFESVPVSQVRAGDLVLTSEYTVIPYEIDRITAEGATLLRCSVTGQTVQIPNDYQVRKISYGDGLVAIWKALNK